MIPFLLRRFILALLTLFGVVLLVFVMVRLVPGDVVTNLVGIDAHPTPEQLANLRRLFGLDLPIHVQFGKWFGALLTGDLGESLRTNRSIASDLALRLPVTLELTVLALSRDAERGCGPPGPASHAGRARPRGSRARA